MININYTQAEKEAALKKESGVFEVVVDGVYEVKVDSIEQKEAKSGAPMIEMWYTIRGDFVQEHQGARLGNWIVADKETRKYDSKRFQEFCIQHGVPTGSKFASLDDLLKFIASQNLVIKVKVFEQKVLDEDKKETGEIRKQSRVINVKPSELGKAGAIEEDLPF